MTDPLWTKARAEALRLAGYRCHAQTPMCLGMGIYEHWDLAVHHIAGRGKKKGEPGWEHRQENLLVCHHECHVYIHSHPTESYENGWMQRRNDVVQSDEF